MFLPITFAVVLLALMFVCADGVREGIHEVWDVALIASTVAYFLLCAWILRKLIAVDLLSAGRRGSVRRRAARALSARPRSAG